MLLLTLTSYIRLGLAWRASVSGVGYNESDIVVWESHLKGDGLYSSASYY